MSAVEAEAPPTEPAVADGDDGTLDLALLGEDNQLDDFFFSILQAKDLDDPEETETPLSMCPSIDPSIPDLPCVGVVLHIDRMG